MKNMTNKKGTKRALLSSVIALILCFSMLLGTSYAWFTDSVTSANNIIKSGTLDVELYYADGKDAVDSDAWTNANGVAIFDHDKWEPGYTVANHLKVSNKGTLALQYQLAIVPTGEVSALAEVIDVYFVDGGKKIAGRTDLSADHYYGTLADLINNGISSGNLEAGKDYIATIVLKMQETAGNEYQNLSIGDSFTIQLLATQVSFEEDSFDDQYDADACVVADTASLQAVLDRATTGTTIQLVAGVKYGAVEIRPTANNETTMVCETHSYTTTDATEFIEHLNDGSWHTSPRYTTTIKDITIIGAEGATVAGLTATSGHVVGPAYDYVRGYQKDEGSLYYGTLNISNLTFKNVAFTGKVDLSTSDETSVYDGVTFDGCSFTTGGIESTNGAAIRYYNEANNGNVKNITVTGCSFTNCYQGVYVHHVNGITVTGSTFNTTGHNAIALQGHDGAVNLKNVVITGNTFTNIGDRVIRFNEVGADSNITIQNNTATNSGDEGGEVMKATSIASGVVTNISGNTWNGTVVNEELNDQ